jgi:hypothetical protein
LKIGKVIRVVNRRRKDNTMNKRKGQDDKQ